MNSKAIAKYQKGDSIGKPEEKTFLLCYERILDAAVKHDPVAVERGLSLLENSLRMEANPVLVYHLVKLYGYCRYCVTNKKFDEVCRIIESLRDTWSAAIELDQLPDIDPTLGENQDGLTHPDFNED